MRPPPRNGVAFVAALARLFFVSPRTFCGHGTVVSRVPRSAQDPTQPELLRTPYKRSSENAPLLPRVDSRIGPALGEGSRVLPRLPTATPPQSRPPSPPHPGAPPQGATTPPRPPAPAVLATDRRRPRWGPQRAAPGVAAALRGWQQERPVRCHRLWAFDVVEEASLTWHDHRQASCRLLRQVRYVTCDRRS